MGKKLKLYRITRMTKIDYDEYTEFFILASNVNSALLQLWEKFPSKDYEYLSAKNISFEVIDLEKAQIVTVLFNAG